MTEVERPIQYNKTHSHARLSTIHRLRENCNAIAGLKAFLDTAKAWEGMMRDPTGVSREVDGSVFGKAFGKRKKEAIERYKRLVDMDGDLLDDLFSDQRKARRRRRGRRKDDSSRSKSKKIQALERRATAAIFSMDAMEDAKTAKLIGRVLKGIRKTVGVNRGVRARRGAAVGGECSDAGGRHICKRRARLPLQRSLAMRCGANTAVLCSALLCSLFCSALFSALLCFLLCSAVLCSAALSSTLLCSPLLFC